MAQPPTLNEMRFRQWTDLTVFGICHWNQYEPSACALGTRVQCDVTKEAAAMVAEYLGLTSLPVAPPANMIFNHGMESVGTVMLPRSILRELIQFAIFYTGGLAYFEANASEIQAVYSQATLDRMLRDMLPLVHNPLRELTDLRTPTLRLQNIRTYVDD